MDNSFSLKLKQLALSNGVVTKKLGIPRRTMEHWCSGESKPPAWTQRMVLYGLNHIEDAEFLEELEKYKPED